MKLRTVAIFLLVLLHGGFASAQTEPKFPIDNFGSFTDQLGSFMTASKRPDMEEAFSVFRSRYRAGNISDDKMARIASLSNKLAEQRLSPFPYFKNYVNALSAVVIDPDTSMFNRWHRTAEQLVAATEPGRVKPIGQFLEFSADFMEFRALHTGEGGAATWKIKGGKFDFAFRDKQPQLVCEKVDLIGVRKNDSIVVRRTSGTYTPYDNVWRGTGGNVNWESAFLDSTVNATLTRYAFETTKPLLKCDTVTFQYPLYLSRPEMGRFEHNIIVRTDSTPNFPRFESFNKKIAISNRIAERVNFVGGFQLQGNSVYGYGQDSLPAQLTVLNKNNQPVFYGEGQLFILRRQQSVIADGVAAKLIIDADSLFHPAIGLRLNLKKQAIQLIRGQKGPERNPFYSSYYKMNLDAESLVWDLVKDSLDIGARLTTAKGISQKVQFESSNRFDPKQYDKYQNIANYNAIAVLYTLSEEQSNNIKVVSDNAFAKALNPAWDYSSIQTLLAQMVQDGFINYDFKKHLIEVRPKLQHYAKASQGKVDYDAINIVSESTNANAKLDMKTKQTTIYEVKHLEISALQRVGIAPDDKQLTLLAGRNMRFDGRLFAGYAVFEGKSMAFKYDNFDITLDSVRHLDFYLPEGPADKITRVRKASAMNSTIEKISGVLLVDAPNNKAGRDSLEIFPSLQSKKNSFVYYDRKSIQEGAYKRDSFYFKLNPFSFNKLDDYEIEDLRFKGEMFSTRIFPNFREIIVVRPHDKSFGFIHKIPEPGYPTYSQKGNFKGALDLSNRGFLGKGLIEYLTADIESDDIVFRPSRMTCTARKFFMEEDREGTVKTPQAKGEAVKVNWLPYRDSMYVESKVKDFELFKAPGYNHKGILILTPTGLKGRGVLDWAGGRLSSRRIVYLPFQAGSDTADLQIKAVGGTGIVFAAKNVNGNLDFDGQQGQFKANTANASTELPLNQYRTSMNEFTWDMKAQTINFKSDPNRPGAFVSTDKKQDSLAFSGKTAFYDIKARQLIVGGVENINTADALVLPDSGAVEVLPSGSIKQLVNAKIIANTENKYHTINRATVNVEGRLGYNATGYYAYNLPAKDQEIYFDNIVGEPDKSKKPLTTASGSVAEETGFRLDQTLFFKGELILRADQPNLTANGFAKLDADRLPDAGWFSLQTLVDRTNPLVAVDSSRSEDGGPVVTGFYLSQSSGDGYPSVLQAPYTPEDRPVLDAQVAFKYDAKDDRYTFGDPQKVMGKTPRGTRLVFDNKNGTIAGEGPLSLCSKIKSLKINAAGRLRSSFTTIDTNQYHRLEGDMMSGITLPPLPKILYDIMWNEINAAIFELPNAGYAPHLAFYQYALSEFVSDAAAYGEMDANLKNNTIILPRKDNPYTFLLGRHTVLWNPEYQSFLSLEDKFPVIAINGNPLGKTMTTFVEYQMPASGQDRFYFAIKPTNDLWYYFGYKDGILEVVSSSTVFNEKVGSMKPKDLLIKVGGESVEIQLVDPGRGKAFMERVKSGRTQ